MATAAGDVASQSSIRSVITSSRTAATVSASSIRTTPRRFASHATTALSKLKSRPVCTRAASGTEPMGRGGKILQRWGGLYRHGGHARKIRLSADPLKFWFEFSGKSNMASDAGGDRPKSKRGGARKGAGRKPKGYVKPTVAGLDLSEAMATPDRKSTRLNSSHVEISYAVFCLKKKKK